MCVRRRRRICLNRRQLLLKKLMVELREIVARSCHGDEAVVVAVGQAYVKYWSSNGFTIKSGACYYYLRMITIH